MTTKVPAVTYKCYDSSFEVNIFQIIKVASNETSTLG